MNLIVKIALQRTARDVLYTVGVLLQLHKHPAREEKTPVSQELFSLGSRVFLRVCVYLTGEGYVRTVTVDNEESTIFLFDNWRQVRFWKVYI